MLPLQKGLKVSEVTFYVLNAHNHVPWQTQVCQTLAQLYHARNSIFVLIEDAALARSVDTLLWTYSDTDFVPHALATPNYLGPNEAPVLIGNTAQLEDCLQAGGRDILCHLNDGVPQQVAQFKTVVEWVSVDAEGKQSARARYQQYKAAGVIPNTIPL